MKKIFISQPMADLTDEEILKRREEAVKKLEEFMYGEEFIVIDSFFKNALYSIKPLWFFGKCLQALSDADYVLFLDGWNKARGCRIENICALEYGIQTIYESGLN